MTEWVFLVALIFNGPSNGSRFEYHPMKDMKTCLESVKAAKIEIAKGGDSEGAVALFCTDRMSQKKPDGM